jgi:Family of unknown function (DUF5678)
MTPTIEQAIEIIQQLPPPDRKKFFDWAEEEKRRELADKESMQIELKQKNERFQRALKWIDEHKEEFDGQFVLLDGDRLIARGTDPKPLYDAAREKGIEIPFVKRIKAKQLPFGVW